jgi:hypothetical protein
MSDLPRKNCWTIAEHAGHATPGRMQHLLEACTAPELVAAVLTCGLGGWLGWGKIPFCVFSSPVSDHDPGVGAGNSATSCDLGFLVW